MIDEVLLFIADLLAIVCLVIGLFFMTVGAVGVLRLPDVYHRLHAATKCTTLGLLGLLLAAILHVHALDVMTKALLTVAFTFVASPVGSHMLAKAALADHAPQWSGTIDDEHAKDHPAQEPRTK
ncbi:MAG: monovalent cation/H(+) antiporter subunit G [Phycisphaeraceae bacterium]